MLAEKIKFEEDEKILKQVRKHWFVLFVQLFSLLVTALFPIAVFILLSVFVSNFELNIALQNYTTMFVFGYTVWLLLIWMVGFNVWTNYYLDVWTITNKRLIVVDQRALFFRTTGSFRLERLQDMNVEINGIVATLLDYGVLEAQTATGSEEEFRAAGMPHPRELKSTILEAADQLMKGYGRNPSDSAGV